MKITIVNGSLGGSSGNTHRVLEPLIKTLAQEAEVDLLHLVSERPTVREFESRLEASDAFVFATGTYWDSWGSPMQKFFEDVTALEASPVWMGKPAIAVVTMHSVGGKEVLSRMQGVLSTLGLMLPPMSGFVYSLANHLALQAPEDKWPDHDWRGDFWQLEDLEGLAKNLLLAARTRPAWEAWPVDRADPRRRWI